MFSALGQLEGRSSKFETGALAGLLERRKLCLRGANLRQAPQPDRAVLEMRMLNAVSSGEASAAQTWTRGFAAIRDLHRRAL